MRRLLIAAVLTLLLPAPSTAQDVTLGDRVRVRSEGATWTEGRLMAVEGDSIALARGTERLYVRLSEVRDAERWESSDPAVMLLSSTLGGAAGWWAAGEMFGDETSPEGKWLTGSGGGDAALGAGTGLILGLGWWALNTGDWKDWSLREGI